MRWPPFHLARHRPRRREERSSRDPRPDGRAPRRHNAREFHPVVDAIQRELRREQWVRDGAVRLREEGHVFTGEVLVVPATEDHITRRLEQLTERLLGLDWKPYDIVVVPVRSLDIPSPEAHDGSAPADRQRTTEQR